MVGKHKGLLAEWTANDDSEWENKRQPTRGELVGRKVINVFFGVETLYTSAAKNSLTFLHTRSSSN